MRFGNNFHSRTRSLWLAPIALGCLHFISCAEIPAPVAPVASSGKGLRQLIGEIDGRRLTLHSFSAKLKVKLTRPKGDSVDLNATYIGDYQGNLRLRLHGIFNILALDLALENGRVSCWMPTRKKIVVGTRAEILADGTSELALLAAIGNAWDMFFPRPWSEGATLRRAKMEGEQLVVRSFASETACLGSFTIDPARRAITQQNVFNRKGLPLGQAEYSDFCTVGTFIDSHDSAPQFDPSQFFSRHIHLADSGHRLLLDLTVEKIVLNPKVPDGAYTLTLPADLPISDFGAVLAAGKPLFE